VLNIPQVSSMLICLDQDNHVTLTTHWKYYSFWWYNPFKDDESLHNICNGIKASESVNFDNANDIGQNILGRMTGQSTISYSFKKKGKAITLGAKNCVKIAGEEIDIDPMFLFQHLITDGERTNDFPLLFKYELSSYPTILFTNQPVLCLRHRNILWQKLSCSNRKHHPTCYKREYPLYIRWWRLNPYTTCVLVFNGYSDGS